MEWLLAFPPEQPLPSATAIGKLLDMGDGYSVCQLFDLLQRQRRIDTRTGTRSAHRGERIVRLKNGRILKTAGCPWDAP